MGGGQSGGHLPGQCEGLRFRQGAGAMQVRRKRLAGEQFHGQKSYRAYGTLMHFQVKNAADIGMSNAAGQLNFVTEAGQGGGHGGDFGANGFQRDALTEQRVFGFVYFAHAAATQQARDAKTSAGQLARRERGGARRGAELAEIAIVALMLQQLQDFRAYFRVIRRFAFEEGKLLLR